MFDLLGIEIHEGNLVWDSDFGQGKVLSFYEGAEYPIMVGFKFKKGIPKLGCLYNGQGIRSDCEERRLSWNKEGAKNFKKEDKNGC